MMYLLQGLTVVGALAGFFLALYDPERARLEEAYWARKMREWAGESD